MTDSISILMESAIIALHMMEERGRGREGEGEREGEGKRERVGFQTCPLSEVIKPFSSLHHLVDVVRHHFLHL